MSHECEACGQTFDTLTRLRLHECGSETESSTADVGGHTDGSTTSEEATPAADWSDTRSDAVTVETLDTILTELQDGESTAIYQALATYEEEVTAAIEADESDRYQGLRRVYREPLITELDAVTQQEGWSVLADCLDAYHPTAQAEFPQVTTILQNVTARYLIRTRLRDGVEAIPVEALDYFEAIRTDVGEYQDFIIEGLHPYGWGIGHPEIDVAGNIRAHATEHIFSTNPMLEHALYADQSAAVELLEQLVHDEAIQQTITRPGQDMSGARYLLDAAAGAASEEFWPSVPRYWEWYADPDLGFEFELTAPIERRIRALVREEGLDANLPADWALTDLTI